jgi:hypothetical protein
VGCPIDDGILQAGQESSGWGPVQPADPDGEVGGGSTQSEAEKQRQENPQMPVVTVDLGVNRLAVMGGLGTGDCEPRGS